MPLSRSRSAVTALVLGALLLASAPGGAGAEPADPARIEAGRALFENHGCIACHGDGGIRLMALDIYSAEELASAIAAPATPMMPAFDLPKDEVDAIIAFLQHEFR